MDDTWSQVVGALFLFAPAGWANMAPVWFAKLPYFRDLSWPLDFGLTFRGQRIFGDHKTIRGIVSGTITGAIIAAIIQFGFDNFDNLARFDLVQDQINFVLLGGLMGFGALAGDATKSFFKRQIGVKPGKSWVPLDQIDYIVGGMIFVAIFIDLQHINYLTIFLFYTFIHPIISYSAYLVRLKDDPL